MRNNDARIRRAKRSRSRIKEQRAVRLSVYRTPRHIYAQVIAADGASTLAAASTLEPAVRKEIGYGGNVAAAAVIGKLVAERASQAGVERVAFDRAGFKYHGRIKALADAAREQGLKF